MLSLILIWLAALSLGMLALGWVFYPLLLALLCYGRSAIGKDDVYSGPRASTISVVVATRESPAVVKDRVENIRGSDFDADRLQVVIALDATVTNAPSEYAAAVGGLATVVLGDLPGGKSAALNAGVRAAHGDMLIFTDSSQTFAATTISRIASAVGTKYAVVSGRLVTSAGADGGVVKAFWRYETWIRRHEARLHSVIGVTGAIYAMRRILWRPLEAGVLCDDVVVPMRLVLSGHRIGYCDQALAYDARHFNGIEEYRRKVRTQTGILQLCALEPRLLNPMRNPVWFQFVCHKLVRVASPVLLMLTLPGVAVYLDRVRNALPERFLVGLLLFFAILGLGAVLATRGRLFRHIVNVALLLAAPLTAMYFASRGKWDVWARAAKRP